MKNLCSFFNLTTAKEYLLTQFKLLSIPLAMSLRVFIELRTIRLLSRN